MPQISTKITEAIGYIKTSHQQVKAGVIIDLNNFQNDMQVICEEISKLPLPEAKTHIDRLQGLSDALRELEIDLRRLSVDVKQEVHNLNAQEKASKSYTNANHITEENKNGN